MNIIKELMKNIQFKINGVRYENKFCGYTYLLLKGGNIRIRLIVSKKDMGTYVIIFNSNEGHSLMNFIVNKGLSAETDDSNAMQFLQAEDMYQYVKKLSENN